jgi:phosphoribosylformylglycinamidine synthase I
MKAAVVTFPGSNCDYDCLKAVEQVGAEALFVWHRAPDLGDVDLVVLPGGFSYGDYLRPGAIARFSPIMDSVVEFARKGGPVLGICNGFQILCEVGLLPGALLRNESLKFQSHDCWLRVENPDTIFTRHYQRAQVLRMPLAHADGNYHADEETLSRLEGEDRIVFRYVNPDGGLGEGSNPNGSAHNIAGIVNEAGNVLGMMPHPDRAMEPILGSTDGVGLFASVVEQLAGSSA